MNTFKKYVSIILTAIMLLSVAACGDESGGGSDATQSESVSDAPDTSESEPATTEEPAVTEEEEYAAEPRRDYGDNLDADYSGIVSAHGQLSIENGDLVDKNGEPYQLRGMSTHGIQWFPQFVNKGAIQTLRDDWNTNVLRLAMYTGEDEGYTEETKEQIWGYVEDGIDICIELDMYVIVDWHILNDRTPLKREEDAVEFFEHISAKYGDKENVIYEICNEPNSPATWAKDIKPYSEEIIPLIRNNAPESVIIVGTAQWSQLIDEPMNDPEPLEYDNLMYALHFYAGTHKEWLRDKLTECYENELPVFVTEFGMCDASGNGRNDFDEAEKWLKLLDRYNVSYINWNFADKEETCSAIKPDAGAQGNWNESDLTEAGAWIRNYFKGRVPNTGQE